MEDIVTLLKAVGVGPRPTDDPFFSNTYETCKVFERFGVTVEDEEELCHEVMKEFRCNACNATFENLLDYELHYHNSHHFVCTVCKKYRPTTRLLEIHVQETHDSFFQVLADKQPMYQCFVSECTMKFKDSAERKEHCISIHEFPKNYRFYFNHDDASSQSSKVTESDLQLAMDIDQEKHDKKKQPKIYFENSKQKTFRKQKFNIPTSTDLNNEGAKVETKMKPVTMFIPRQVQQKSYAKKLTQNKEMEKEVLESGSLMELADSLPKV